MDAARSKAVAHLIDAFQRIDVNDDFRLDPNELLDARRTPLERFSRAGTNAFNSSALDVNRDHFIDISEFLAVHGEEMAAHHVHGIFSDINMPLFLRCPSMIAQRFHPARIDDWWYNHYNHLEGLLAILPDHNGAPVAWPEFVKQWRYDRPAFEIHRTPRPLLRGD